MRKALANLGFALLALLFVPLYVLLVALFFFAVIPIGASWYVVKIVTLKSRWRRVHGRHGKFILFVYSNSPNWKDYIEANILPHIKDHCVILNWSDRSSWEKNRPWEVNAFEHWGGHREFNPIAIIIPPSGRVQTIRFWQAFRAYKHGKDLKLRKAQALLFEVVDTHAIAMRVFPKTAGTFRQIVNERGAILRTMSRDELLAARDQPTEHLTVENRSTTISLIVESKPDGSLRVVVQGFMKALIGYSVAMDGFYKRPDGSVTPMPDKEFYEFD